MNAVSILWYRPRDVLLYSCEAYRIWMVSSQRESVARSYAEMPLATHIGIVLYALLMAIYPDFRALGRGEVFIILLFGAVIAHNLIKPSWGTAAEIYARYRPTSYPREVFVSGLPVVFLLVSLVFARDHPALILCAIAAHWLIVGTVFYALMERRRLPDQQGTPSLP